MTLSIIWSVHDVTPASIGRVDEIIELLSSVAGAQRICILIVPDGSWTDADVATLRGWEGRGYLLGAHGWSHRSLRPRGIYHRLHSLLFSRDVAEHLGRSTAELREIVARGQRWFDDAGLAPPALYVPPAWVLGALPLSAFHDTSMRWIETLTGIYDARRRRFHRLPLVGFEADTWLRAASLRCSNAINLALASTLRRPLRVAVHPDDLDLLLARDLRSMIAGGYTASSPDDLRDR